jgi:flagellar protein FlaG
LPVINTETLFILSDITISNACIIFKEDESMRISGDIKIESMAINKQSGNVSSGEATVKQGSEVANSTPKVTTEKSINFESNDDIKKKVQEAVQKMNDMLEVNNSTSKFMYHDGLERYYVTVVDRATEEVVKEIPPKKLLDAFYEMQKMLGMIVDEKI